VWLVRFMQYDLGFFDHETDRVTGAETPSTQKRYLCARIELFWCRLRDLNPRPTVYKLELAATLRSYDLFCFG
jgi:hypothetical protein